MTDLSTHTLPTPPEAQGPRRDKLLVVVDDTPEVRVALRFAAGRARRLKNGLVLLRVTPPIDFQHWSSVADAMRQEAQEEAEALLRGHAESLMREHGLQPQLVVREGVARDELLALIQSDRDIRVLVLAAASNSNGPGPLVTAFTQMAGQLPIPITIVPGGLSEQEIDALT